MTTTKKRLAPSQNGLAEEPQPQHGNLPQTLYHGLRLQSDSLATLRTSGTSTLRGRNTGRPLQEPRSDGPFTQTLKEGQGLLDSVSADVLAFPRKDRQDLRRHLHSQATQSRSVESRHQERMSSPNRHGPELACHAVVTNLTTPNLTGRPDHDTASSRPDVKGVTFMLRDVITSIAAKTQL